MMENEAIQQLLKWEGPHSAPLQGNEKRALAKSPFTGMERKKTLLRMLAMTVFE